MDGYSWFFMCIMIGTALGVALHNLVLWLSVVAEGVGRTKEVKALSEQQMMSCPALVEKGYVVMTSRKFMVIEAP